MEDTLAILGEDGFWSYLDSSSFRNERNLGFLLTQSIELHGGLPSATLVGLLINKTLLNLFNLPGDPHPEREAFGGGGKGGQDLCILLDFWA